MTFKSSPSAVVAVSALWLALTVGFAFAQPLASPSAASPAPATSPAAKPKSGYVRFFNGMPLTGISLELVVGMDNPPKVLQGSGPASFYAPYASLPPGQYLFRVFKMGDRQTPLKSFNMQLKDKSYYTILASQQPGGPPVVELLDETPSADPTKPTPNQVTVRQYCQNANVIVSAGNKQTDTLAYGKAQTLTGFPDAAVPLMVRATLNPGGLKTWGSEADFRINHRATLYIVTDPYGRLRTRLSADGPTVAEEAANAAAATASHTP